MPDVNPEPYTGAFYTVRYGDMCDRLGSNPFEDAFDSVFAVGGPLAQSDYPQYYALKAKLVKLFINRNWFKEIGAETPDDFGIKCMQAIAESAGRWEVPLEMMAKATFDVTNPDKEGQIIKYGHSIENVIQDTPYGTLSATADYASGKAGTYHTGQDEIATRNDLDAYVMMDLRRKWNDNINEIVKEFDDLFIRIVGAEMVL